ncbi:MAG: hypothetical protein V2I33_18775 [Kangiellaceae bacterium]|jgi:hypothetical protein|nr:hypothetical protein [Kangiellaceae bacterium]
MQVFLNSIQTLIKHIQENNSLDSFSFDLITLVNVSKDNLSKIQQEVKDMELIHVHEFWELTEEVYKRLMLRTIAQELQDYFSQLQKLSNKFVEITYEFQPWKEFVLRSSHSQETKLTLKTSYAENQIQNLLIHLGVQDQTWLNDLYDFDYKFNFESEVEALFRGLAFDCWRKAKSATQCQLNASLKEIDGGSFTYDLDTREVIK